MFSAPYPTSLEIVEELGDKFIEGLVNAVRASREDIHDMRAWRPNWFPTMHSRCLSNLIHDRIWAHLVASIEQDSAVTILDKGATREIVIGIHLRLRVKRHRDGDRISTYPTPTALEFWLQGGENMIPGLEEVRVGVGYRWLSETREIGAPIVSLRDGKDNVIWAIELSEPVEGQRINWKPIEPTLPGIDFGDLDAASDDEGEASSE